MRMSDLNETARKHAEQAAKIVLDNGDALRYTITLMEHDYIELLLATDMTDSESRDAYYHRINALRDVEAGIKMLARTNSKR